MKMQLLQKIRMRQMKLLTPFLSANQALEEAEVREIKMLSQTSFAILFLPKFQTYLMLLLLKRSIQSHIIRV